MSQADMLSINAVAAKLGLSVHQLRRWELMFGLEIKRGRGQQRQYRSEDMSVLERIKELVEQGWPTSQIRPQLEAEGLVTPKLIGMPPPPGNPEVLSEALIGFRNFTERRFIEISKQIDELRQLLISITLKQELSGEPSSPWQPVQREFAPEPKTTPAQEISIGPDFSAGPPVEFTPPPPPPQRTSIIGAPTPPKESTFEVGPSSGSFSTPSTSFSSSQAPPERRSIIGEPTPAPPSPLASSAPVMSEEEADALLEEEDLEDEDLGDDEAVAAAPPPPPAPVAAKDSLLDEDLDEDEEIDEDEDLDEEEEETSPPVSAPTITPVTSSSAFSSGAPTSTTSSGSFSPVGSEASMPPPTLPSPPPDPFKSSPFLTTPPPPPEPPAPPRPPEPAMSEPSSAPTPAEPASSFAPSSPSLTPAAAGDMFSSVIQSVNDAAARESSLEPPTPPRPSEEPLFSESSAPVPPPPAPPPPAPGPGGTPFTPPGAESSPFIPTPPSSSSSPFLTPPPAPYMSGGSAPQQAAQPFEPSAPPEPEPAPPAPPAPPEPPKAAPAPAQKGPFLGEITDQNYLTILGRALDLVGWSDEQADGFSVSRFKVPHWDELGRSQAEVLIEHLLSELQSQMSSES